MYLVRPLPLAGVLLALAPALDAGLASANPTSAALAALDGPTGRALPAPMPAAQPASQDAPSASAQPTRQEASIFGRSAISVRTNYVSYESPEARVHAFELLLLGQVLHRSGFGAYASLPIGYARVAHEFGTRTYDAIGGLDMGGVWAANYRGLTTIARAGVILPTAPEYGDKDFWAMTIAPLASLSDSAQLAPASTWVRASVSPTLLDGHWLIGVDLGVDVPLTDPAERIVQGDIIENFRVSTLVRANVALGVVLGDHQILGEFHTLYSQRTEVDSDDHALHTFGASYRYRGKWQPFVSVQKITGRPRSESDLGLGISTGVATQL